MAEPFASGKNAVGLCDRCAWIWPLKDLKYQIVNMYNTNMLMCPNCLDLDQPQYQVGRYPIYDPQAIRHPRPDQYNDRSLFGFNPVLKMQIAVLIGNVTITIT